MMGRSPCCSKVGLNKGAWTASEDKILTDYIKLHGEGKWRNLPKNAGLKRCGKSCRLRWLNYLRPDIKRGNISQDEEELIIRLHKLLGNRWSLIAGRLPGRTDNEIKNYWNTNLGKKVPQDNHIAASPAPNQPTRSDEKPKKKAKKIKETDHNDDSNVVRTKALRCSKSFFTPQPQRNIGHIDDKLDKNIIIPEKQENFVTNERPITKPMSESSGSPCWDSSFCPEQDNGPSNFMLSIDLGETVSLSDLFGSDFMEVFDSAGYDQSTAEMSASSSSSLDKPTYLSKEILDHFSSIPELWGDWLA